MTSPGKVKLGPRSVLLRDDVEKSLYDHIKQMECRMYVLTTLDIRRLAYEIAVKTGVNNPFNETTKMAGKDWLCGCFARHPDLAIKETQATSIARALGFNKATVNEFFQIYRSVLETAQYTLSRVWNMDETGITDVQRPGKLVATKGARHVAKVTSGERGATVTVVCAINAAGYLPPMFIFPRKRMVAVLMNGAPPESVGCCIPNGWIDADLFVKWLEHFAASTNACKENQQIIIMDGHHSHKTLAAITFARSKGIQLLVLPPHCTHRMQPLDTTFFKSLNAGPSSDELPSAGPSSDDHATTDMPADETAASLHTVGCVASTQATRVIRDLIPNISPLPKTSSARSKSRKQDSAAWVSSSPYKNALRRKVKHLSGRVKEAGSRRENDRCLRKQMTITVHAKRFRSDLSSDEDEEWHCLICGEPFSNSRSREVWVQCVLCRDWAHGECTEGNANYICENCCS